MILFIYFTFKSARFFLVISQLTNTSSPRYAEYCQLLSKHYLIKHNQHWFNNVYLYIIIIYENLTQWFLSNFERLLTKQTIRRFELSYRFQFKSSHDSCFPITSKPSTKRVSLKFSSYTRSFSYLIKTSENSQKC